MEMEAVVAQFKELSRCFLGGTEETAKSSGRIAGLREEF
jgi:hypothetical protein